MDDTKRNKHFSKPEIPILYPQEAREIVGLLSDLPSTVVHDDTFSVEIVEENGDVTLLKSGVATEAKDAKLKTTLTELPLATYQDGELQHKVSLYARRVTGYYNEVGATEDDALFVVDQVTDPDGEKYLAATPGLLDRGGSVRGEHRDDSQLTVATLQGLGGAEGIKRFIEATASGEGEVVAEIAQQAEAAFRRRGTERITTTGFDLHSWTSKGFETAGMRAQRRAEYEAQRQREDEIWRSKPAVRKLGAWVAWKVADRYASSAKDSYFGRQRRRDRDDWW